MFSDIAFATLLTLGVVLHSVVVLTWVVIAVMVVVMSTVVGVVLVLREVVVVADSPRAVVLVAAIFTVVETPGSRAGLSEAFVGVGRAVTDVRLVAR